ncbi:DUF5343 domain-containing protein [Mucilaginibacter sp. R-33]|uniref:DUF5343 domain-containing protein n=1 Tax=Mucilaginibacter sp. R-33 TaxID=3416711 RepID=UPI003CFA2274
MANDNPVYPVLTATTWWKLRKKFNASIPKEVSASYLAAALDMTENSAKTNVIAKLRLIGFIDENNKPTEIAVKWRDDVEYPKVCEELIEKLYPSELTDAIDSPLENKNKVVKWFQNKARVGEKAAMMMAAFYFLLVEADPSKQISATQSKPEKTAKNVKAKEIKVKETPPRIEQDSQVHMDSNPKLTGAFKPTIHLDIQIHISPDSSVEQIDKIFESMAKHLSGFKL